MVQLLNAGQVAAAAAIAAARITEAPDCWRADRAMGKVFDHDKQPFFAAEHYRRAKSLYARQPDWNAKGMAALLTEWATAELRAGELETARDAFTAAIRQDKDYLPAAAGLKEVTSKLATVGTRDHNGHALLNQGHDAERAGDYARAWALWSEAKQELARAGFAYDAPAIGQRFAQYRGHCTKLRMARLVAIADHGAEMRYFGPWRPLFILGYPRSGTTLLEQCLAQSPWVTPGDELPYLTELVNNAPRFLDSDRPYPWCLDDLAIANTRVALDDLRNHYRSRVLERLGANPHGRFVTDKMPLNETYLPFIRLLFPDSVCILVERNPLDVIVSNFALFLTHGSHQACDPLSCHHHLEAVHNLVRHYASRLPGLRLLRVQYHDLVEQPAATLQAICNFAGLDYTDDMTHPEQSTRYCRTASWAQVREPISTKTLGRWRRFEPQLRAALGDIIVNRYV